MPLRVEVVHALPDRAEVVAVRLAAGATVRDAIAASGLKAEFGRLGIFGATVKLDTPLRDGDRVEIYRPLVLDPKEARRRRARRKR